VFHLPSDIESLIHFDSASLGVTTREGKHFEFKSNFRPNDLSDYGKTLAAFSNADGGVLIFGVSEEPRKIVGVDHIVDEAEWANRLREDFDPEIVISTRIYRVGSLRLLAVGVDQSLNKPVVCRKSRSKSVKGRDGKVTDVEVLREGSIYFRYAGQTKYIGYAELTAMLAEQERKRIQAVMQTLKVMERLGPDNSRMVEVEQATTQPDPNVTSPPTPIENPEPSSLANDALAQASSVPEVRKEGLRVQSSVQIARRNTYYVYTKKFDQTIRADQLAKNDESTRLNRKLVRRNPDRGSDRLIAEIFTKLNRIAKPPSMSIALLLDNSGSMQDKILALARTALLLVEVLETWQIRTEVLGFTTRSFGGGQSGELWREDGKPISPGRLNDLRHVVYKTFDETASVSSRRLGVMLQDDLLKEGIHGEALLWAYSRLIQEVSKTRLLFMFTDSFPNDQSTARVQGDDFLKDHFKSVVQQIMSERRVLLKLVGVDCDLSDVLADAITAKASKLASPVFDTLRAFI